MQAEPEIAERPAAREDVTPRYDITDMELFAGADAEAIEPFLRECSIEYLAKGETLIEAGVGNRHMYIVLNGELGVHLGGRDEPALVTVTPGETLGELSLIDGKPGSAYVIAADDSRVLVLDEELVWLLVRSFHAVSTNLLFVLARRLRRGNDFITEDREQLRKYRFKATIDALTGLFNRYWLDQMLPRQMDRAHRAGQTLSLIMLDIDHFKRINDACGHTVGDEVIRQVAEALRANIRVLDHAARYGGEEFALICPDTAPHDALGLAERLRLCVAAEVQRSGAARGLPLTISLGVAQLTGEQTPEAFIAKADQALYRAKNGGRNRVSA